jgi:hypothetical protein
MGGYTLGHLALSPTIRRGLNRCAGCGLALALLLAAAASWAATYRWVDEKGKVHYGDRIPPQFAGQGHTELNSQGRVIRRVERTPNSAEARERRERETARKELEEREATARQRRDNALMATFSSLSELEQAKARALDQEKSMLDGLQVMRKNSASKAESDYIDEMIRQRREQMEATRTKYDADLSRYKALTGGR